MNGGESGNEKKENFKVEITFNIKCQYSKNPHIRNSVFQGRLISFL